MSSSYGQKPKKPEEQSTWVTIQKFMRGNAPDRTPSAYPVNMPTPEIDKNKYKDFKKGGQF